MKKLLFIICFIFSSFFSNTNVNAADKDYSIDKLNLNAEITQNGDVNVIEEITYNFQGNYNGIYRNLLMNGTSGYTITNVSVKDKNNNIVNLPSTNNEENNSYEIINSNDKTQIKVFNKSDNETKTFVFNYIIHDVAEKSADNGLLNWSFYNVENNKNINDVNLKLSLSSANFDLNKLKYYCYIDGGEFKTNNDDKNIYVEGKNLTSQFAIKVLFQPEYLINTNKISNSISDNNNTSQIAQNNLLDEKKYNDLQSKEFILILVIAIATVSLFLFIIIRRQSKFRKELEEYRKNFIFFNENTLNYAPSDLQPALVATLYFDKNLPFSVIPATLFYLSKLGYYTFEKNNSENDIVLLRVPKKELPISDSLSYFLKWFSAYEKNNKLSLNKLKDKLTKREDAISFKNQYDYWKNKIKFESNNLDFYTVIRGKTVLSNYAYNEKLKWDAYKEYILNTLEETTPPESFINIDDTIIYAFAFDFNILKFENLFKKIEDSAFEDGDFYLYNIYNNYSTFYLWDEMDRILNYSNNDSSNFSSGDSSNFGGFSDGGGFSGGGGGDSGAF